MDLGKVLHRKGYRKVKLKKLKTNHLLIKGEVNGVKGRFILDTGASNSCVDSSLQEKFNLIATESETKAAGAGAIGMDTMIATKNSVKFGNWTYKNFSIVIFDLGHVNTALVEHKEQEVDGIIGADILEHGEALIDYNKCCVYLKRLVYKY